MSRRKPSNYMPPGSVDVDAPGGPAADSLDLEAEVARGAGAAPAGELVDDDPLGVNQDTPAPAAEEPKKRKRGRGRGAAANDDTGEAPPPAAGTAEGEVTGDDFLQEQAKADRGSAKAKHVDDGLDGVAEMVDRMRKAIAYARVEPDHATKLHVLASIADTAAIVADDARRAVAAAQNENRNLQRSS